METRHELNRLQICLFCMGKNYNICQTTELLEVKVIKVFSLYNASDPCLRTSLYSGCRRHLYNFNQGMEKKFLVVDISEYYANNITSNYLNLVCNCLICRLTGMPNLGTLQKVKFYFKRKIQQTLAMRNQLVKNSCFI